MYVYHEQIKFSAMLLIHAYTRELNSEPTGYSTVPGTMPSSTAALVAFSASVTLSFFSPTSVSLAPPI